MGIDMTPTPNNPNTHDATVCALKIDIKEEDKERLIMKWNECKGTGTLSLDDRPPRVPTRNDDTYYYASFSGGKDSTAMVLRLLEKKWPMEEVIFCDTGMEYPEIYENVQKMKEIVERHGIKFTTLKSDKTFEYYMFDKPTVNKDKDKPREGLGWPGVFSRWCTKFMKTNIIHDYIKQIDGEHTNAKSYVGIAADERESGEETESQEHPPTYPMGNDGGGLFEILL